MVSPEIVDYVKTELAKCISEDKIRHVLMEHGWPEYEINEAFEKAKKVEEKPEEAEEKPEAEVKPPEEVAPAEVKPEVEEGPKPEEKPVKPPIMEDVKKIVTNKVFIIAAVIIVLGSVAFFVLPSLFVEESVDEISGAMAFAEGQCGQYCNSNLCGLFNNPEFTHPELEGLTCKDLGISCLLPDGAPKCETEY